MRILISGVCGFVGSVLARGLARADGRPEVHGFDNFVRPGSESNRAELKSLGVRLHYADLRSPSDLAALPACDWVIDAAANPSVLAGVDGAMSSRQVIEHNLTGTTHLLEYAKGHRAGFILLSTSRVYSIPPLAALPVAAADGAFRPTSPLPAGVSAAGISESFSTLAPISLYGAAKLASEALALEYGETYELPVFINRCGVLAGAGQFGRADQGIFSYWIHSWARKRRLKYIGFGGTGHQVRDCLHPRDLVPLLLQQMNAPRLPVGDRIANLSGGAASAMSLLQLSRWCAAKFGPHDVLPDLAPRKFDLPWIVLDSVKAGRLWQWRPQTLAPAILEEIAVHAAANPEWLDLSAPL